MSTRQTGVRLSSSDKVLQALFDTYLQNLCNALKKYDEFLLI